MDDDLPLESRTGVSGLFGKLDAELKIRMTYDTLASLRVKANKLNMSVSEYARLRLEISENGLNHVASLQYERLRQVAGQVDGMGDGQ